MRLTKAQERLLSALQTKKGRVEHGMFIVEGAKVVREAQDLAVFTFTPSDTPRFREFVATETPQDIAAVVRAPSWTLADVVRMPTVVVLDGVQDPGNVGTILRACLGFHAGLLLVESSDVTNPKTVRSSVAAVLRVPWVSVPRGQVEQTLASIERPVFRLELGKETVSVHELPKREHIVLIAGSEGQGIRLGVNGTSVKIPHDRALESLNVGVAVSIALYERMKIVDRSE
ncbi:MAG: RNA methyltransferase [Candidatus Uhrbacteria bacterium]|nr:RNA methyltransferase [Candidatus Uhrbacteria bacterium]